jgi:hypothetical protein
MIDVSIVGTGASPSGRRRGGTWDVDAALMEREPEKIALPAARRIQNE